MFSDESKFCISFGNQGPRVWRKRGEAQNPRCLRSSVKFPQSVMVWGAMSSAGVGPLCFLRSKVNTAVYQEILEHFMLPAADQLYGDADFIFQQDLAPAHSAKATSTWFKDHGIPVLGHVSGASGERSVQNVVGARSGFLSKGWSDRSVLLRFRSDTAHTSSLGHAQIHPEFTCAFNN